ncbi:MAG: hypothetical protein ACR2N4_14370 [Jatrophihabitans sp.]
MIPADFEAFFAAMAGAAAALVGLLFVAISVTPHRLVQAETRVESQTLAGSALVAFSNALVTSTIALIPGVNIGWAALPLGVGGVAFTAAQARALITDRAREGAGFGWIFLVLAMLVVFGWEVVAGIRLLLHQHSVGAVTTLAALLVASLTLGIGRAWRLVGMRDTGLAHSVTALLRGASEDGRPPGRGAEPSGGDSAPL